MKRFETLSDIGKLLALIFFGLVTLGAGLCGAASLVVGIVRPIRQGVDLSFLVAGFGLFFALVAGACMYAVWTGLPDMPRDPPFEKK